MLRPGSVTDWRTGNERSLPASGRGNRPRRLPGSVVFGVGVSRHLEPVRVRCLCRPRSGTWPRGPCGRSGGGCSTSWPRLLRPMAGKPAEQAVGRDVRTMRDARAAGAVVDKRTHQASRPLRSGAHRPILQSGKLRPTTVLHCQAEEVGKSEVTPSEVGNLFSPEHRLNWAGTSPAPSPRLWCL